MQKYKIFVTIVSCFIVTSLSAIATKIDIFTAVTSNNHSAVVRAVKQGAELNERNKQGKTVLDIAVERKNKKTARYLLKHGGKVTTKPNAISLNKFLRNRVIGFFVAGLFLTPFMWMGSLMAFCDMDLIEIL